jgi:SAM-dependent methyltransferase
MQRKARVLSFRVLCSSLMWCTFLYLLMRKLVIIKMGSTAHSPICHTSAVRIPTLHERTVVTAAAKVVEPKVLAAAANVVEQEGIGNELGCMQKSLREANAHVMPYACWCSCESIPEEKMRPYNGRPNAMCPDKTLERHRFSCFLLLTKALPAISRLLYVAPHSSSLAFVREHFPTAEVMAGFKRIPGSYVPAGPMLDLDITELAFPDSHFDLLICEHVLEHIPNDRRALQELYRVLRPGGIALLQVPINAPGKITIENVTGVNSEADAIAVYGQKDHVRRYGPDFYERVTEAGFLVEELSFADYYASHLQDPTRFKESTHRGSAAWALKV